MKKLLLGVIATIFAGALFASVVVVQKENTVSILDAPSKDAKVLMTLKSGSKLEQLKQDGLFTEVKTEEGAQGWVKSEYLTDQEQAMQKPVLDRWIHKVKDYFSDSPIINGKQLSLAAVTGVGQQETNSDFENAAMRAQLASIQRQMNIIYNQCTIMNKKNELEWIIYGTTLGLISLLVGVILGRLGKETLVHSKK